MVAVGVRTNHIIEVQFGLLTSTNANLKLMCETVEAAGTEFIGALEDGPGVRRLRK